MVIRKAQVWSRRQDREGPDPREMAAKDAESFSADRRRLAAALALSPFLGTLGGCGSSGGGEPPPTPNPTRKWRMGFFTLPPRPTVDDVLRMVDEWKGRADLVAIHDELPWTDLLSGLSADAILDRDKVQLVNLFKGRGLRLYFMADLTDGLSRGEEAPQLRRLGRSISEPAVQRVYRDYVLAVSRKLAPEFLGLAAETNLTRAIGPSSLYAAEVQAANAAAADLRTTGTAAVMMISVQVETAWGRLPESPSFVGISQDLRDYPFLQTLGLSSYPYFAFSQPEDLPVDYYSRLLQGSGLPAIVTEGGWTSATFGSIQSSPEKQARYLEVQGRLLDSIQARGMIQLLYADLDLDHWPVPIPPSLPLFASLGIADPGFRSKPGLAVWDRLFARTWIP